MPKLNTRDFNYSTLDAETSQFIHQQTIEIKALLRKTAQSIVEIGQRLTEVKQKIGHGKFGSWLRSEFNWSVSAANKFMQVSKEFKFINFTNLKIAPSALYKLAAPSAPAAARKEALHRARLGEYVTYTTANKLIQKYKSESLCRKNVTTLLQFSPSEEANQDASEFSLTSATSVGDRSQTSKYILSDRLKTAESPKKASQQAANFELNTRAEKRELAPISTAATLSTPEILSIIPQKVIAEAMSLTTLVTKESLWQLGNRLLLFCGDPQSEKFQKLLPAEVSLSVAFPPSRSKWQDSFHSGAKSAFSLFTVYQDHDLELLKQAVKQLLLLYTSEDDVVVVSYLAEPELPSISDELNCRCYIAEPNVLLCSAAIAIWQRKTKETAKKVR